MAKQSKSKQKKSAGPIWGKRLASEAGAANVAYCAGWDVRERQAADMELLPYDLWTNRAHCTMLARSGVIAPKDLGRILDALDALEALAAKGKYELDPGLEDVHLNVETFVAEHAGAAPAGQMHTARSRNDQVATDMRLLLRDRVLAFQGDAIALCETLRRLAKRHCRTIMPGLTHHQPAAWTTFGHWAAAHAYAFARDVRALQDLADTLTVSPLGAAASFGTSWPIDRRYAASLLGFSEPQVNSLDCVTNRSEFEARVASALAIWATHAATLSQDLILFSSPPWHLLRIGDAYVTGSSIMPQKRNPDFAEVTKAKAALAGSVAATLLDLTRGDPSGYNREQQWSKYMLLDLFAELGPAPLVLSGALESLQLDKPRMRTLMRDDYLEAADAADYLAQTRGVPFRATYRWLGEAVRLSEEQGIGLAEAINGVLEREEGVRPLDSDEIAGLTDPERLIERRSSQGGPSVDSVLEQCADLQVAVREMKRRAAASRKQAERGLKRLNQAMERHSARTSPK